MKSVSLALKVSQIFQDRLPVDRSKLAQSAADATLAGRMQIMQRNPLVYRCGA